MELLASYKWHCVIMKCFAILCLCWLHLSYATRLPPQWVCILERLCMKFDDAQPMPPVVDKVSCLQSLQENIKSPIIYLFPPVILWSPLEQFRNFLPPVKCPKCALLLRDDNVPLNAVGWRCGTHGERSEPRKLYGPDGTTLLIGRVYACLKGHEVVGYHPGLLEQIPDTFTPFRLWHKTGFTIEFINLVSTLITTGMSISSIRTVLYKKQVSLYYCQMKHFESTVNSSSVATHKKFPTLKDWKNCFSSFLLSVRALSGCF